MATTASLSLFHSPQLPWPVLSGNFNNGDEVEGAKTDQDDTRYPEKRCYERSVQRNKGNEVTLTLPVC